MERPIVDEDCVHVPCASCCIPPASLRVFGKLPLRENGVDYLTTTSVSMVWRAVVDRSIGWSSSTDELFRARKTRLMVHLESTRYLRTSITLTDGDKEKVEQIEGTGLLSMRPMIC